MKTWIIGAAAVVGFAWTCGAADKHAFKVSGLYTETCACFAPCACELTGDVPKDCEGVGAYSIENGVYDGATMKGAKVAYAGKPGKWLRLYIDAPNDDEFAAAEKFARAGFAQWGTIESVKKAKVTIDGENGRYTVKVDDGKIMEYATEPVLGGDKKTPIAIENTHNVLTTRFLQGKSLGLKYHDGDRSIALDKGRNVYFNPDMKRDGEI